VRRLIDEGYSEAKRILTEKRDDLDRLAHGLLEYETLTGSEITRVIAGEPLNRGDDRDDRPSLPPSGGASVVGIPKTRGRRKGGELEPEPQA
jgi:cell division protease FtsH